MQSRKLIEPTNKVGETETYDINHNSTKHSRRNGLAVFWIVNGAHHRFVSFRSSQSVSMELVFSNLFVRTCARSPGFKQRPDSGEDNNGKHGEDDAFGSRTH